MHNEQSSAYKEKYFPFSDGFSIMNPVFRY